MTNRRIVFAMGVWCGLVSACTPALALRAAALATLVADEIAPKEGSSRIACVVRRRRDSPVIVDCVEARARDGSADGLDLDRIVGRALPTELVPVVAE